MGVFFGINCYFGCFYKMQCHFLYIVSFLFLIKEMSPSFPPAPPRIFIYHHNFIPNHFKFIKIHAKIIPKLPKIIPMTRRWNEMLKRDGDPEPATLIRIWPEAHHRNMTGLLKALREVFARVFGTVFVKMFVRCSCTLLLYYCI